MELNPRIQQLGTTSWPHAGTLDVKEKIVCHAECIQLIDRIFPVVVLDASTRCKHKGISTRYLNKIHIPVSIGAPHTTTKLRPFKNNKNQRPSFKPFLTHFLHRAHVAHEIAGAHRNARGIHFEKAVLRW